jgi:hypothetical protein
MGPYPASTPRDRRSPTARQPQEQRHADARRILESARTEAARRSCSAKISPRLSVTRRRRARRQSVSRSFRLSMCQVLASSTEPVATRTAGRDPRQAGSLDRRGDPGRMARRSRRTARQPGRRQRQAHPDRRRPPTAGHHDATGHAVFHSRRRTSPDNVTGAPSSGHPDETAPVT